MQLERPGCQTAASDGGDAQAAVRAEDRVSGEAGTIGRRPWTDCCFRPSDKQVQPYGSAPGSAGAPMASSGSQLPQAAVQSPDERARTALGCKCSPPTSGLEPLLVVNVEKLGRL